MNQATTVISGAEAVVDGAAPHAALVGFYRAFNRRDYELMASNWLRTGRASMSNPLGGIRRGWREISAVYRKIFDGQARVYVEFHDYTLDVGADMFVAAGRERGRLCVADRCIDLSIRTTRIYVRDGNAWKQLHHHGSMDDPRLLSTYQQVLLNNNHGG